MRKSLSFALCAAALSACAGLPEAVNPLGPHDAPRLQRLADPHTGIDQLLLVPLATAAVTGEGIPVGSHVEVGALFASYDRAQGDRVEGVALIIKTVCPTAEPLFAWSRRLDLEVNGVVLEGNPSPDPRLYHIGRMATGVVETLIVPVSPDLLRALAGAKEIHGEIGRRLRFEMGSEHRAGLAAFLDELPASVRRGLRSKTDAIAAFIAL